MQEFRANVNVERTNGGGAVAKLMKCAFSTPKQTSKDLKMQREEDAQGRNVQRQGQPVAQHVSHDLRTYMHDQRIRAVDACWNLFERRHADI